MTKFKKGDIVCRISYNRDVIFQITDVLKINGDKIYILKGLSRRILADSPEGDLEKLDKRIAIENIESNDEKNLYKIIKKIEKRRNKNENNFAILRQEDNRSIKQIYTGRILHLDGDRRYSEKAVRYYRSMGLNAVVKSIPENKQPKVIASLLDKFNPDILVITGHDGMIKKGKNFNDIYNYRNSRHFVNTVNMARYWENMNNKNLAIFAGACQSFYEAIMSAGANFASSPARIMIDFVDPLIVAERIATTDSTKYLTINDIENDLRDGRNGIDGIGSNGKRLFKEI